MVGIVRLFIFVFFFQAEDGIRDLTVTGVQTCALPISNHLAAYWVGMYGGRPLIEKYGRYVLISRRDLDLADRWFARYGELIVFTSRQIGRASCRERV